MIVRRTILLLVLLLTATHGLSSSLPASTFTIAGTVRSSVTNQPIAGATVVIAAVSSRSQTIRFITLQDGRFSFQKLPRGKYSIAAQARGYRLQGLDEHDAYATAVVAGPDLDSEHIDFRLQPDASIEGRITDDQNEPVAQASVRLFRRDTEQGEQKVQAREGTNTDDEGYFRIGHLAPGTYFLAISARPWYAQNYRNPVPPGTDAETAAQVVNEQSELDKTYPLTFYANALDSSSADPIVLNPGEHFTADVVLQAVNSVHLRIHSGSQSRGNGRAGPGFSVEVKQRLFDGLDDSVPGETMMNNAGPGGAMYVVGGLAPGHYIVEVHGDIDANRGSGWYQEVDVAGDTDLTAGTASGFANVSGIIRFEGGDPPADVRVYLAGHDDRDNGAIAEVSPKGEFSFPGNQVRPGTYDVVLANGSGFSLQKMIASGGTAVGRTLQIPAANTVHLACIAARGIGQVDGMAMRDDKGVAGAMIVLVPDDPAHNQPLFRRDQSDSDGSFSLLNVVPGRYTVLAIANGWNLEWANPAVLQKYLSGGTKVQVQGGFTLNTKVQVQ